jgi:hypothetical protein
MPIKLSVTETEIRFTSPPYKVPTIEIAADTPKDATPASLVKFHENARCALMGEAHAVASVLWENNFDGLDITIEPPHSGIARVIVDAGRDEATSRAVLGRMAEIVAGRGVLSIPKPPVKLTRRPQPPSPAH